MRHGRGLYVFKNGSRYLGEWRCGQKVGLGKFYYPDGSWYKGQWKRDVRHGNGVYTYQNGDTYDGAWYKGERHGVGTYTFAEADCKFMGTWKYGKRMGPAEVVFDQHRFHCTWCGEHPVGPAAYSFACKTMALGFVTKPHDSNNGEVAEPEAEPIAAQWHIQNIMNYEFSKLPPEPMPLPISDSEDDECMLSPERSDTIEFPAMEEEEEEQTAVGDTDDDGVVELADVEVVSNII